MKVSILLKKKDSHFFYVYVSISHKRERAIISTDYVISAKYVKNGKITDAARLAEVYNNELLKYQHRINQIPCVEVLAARAIKDIITKEEHPRQDVIDFFAFSDKYISDLADTRREGTATAYKNSLGAFRTYIGRDVLYTFEITNVLLQSYVNTLIKQHKAAKSIKVYLTHIKVLFNACRNAYNDYDTGLIIIKNYPFKKLHIPNVVEQGGRKAITAEEVKKLANMQLPDRLEFGRDMWLLSFYLLGMNMIDMFNLLPKNYKDGHIIYSRQKTRNRAGGSGICIPVNEQAAILINKYRGQNKLLNLSEKYKDVKSVNSRLSDTIKKIYGLLSPDIDARYFTMYSARHTWASIAANDCRFSDSEVARALNHQSEHRITRGYIRPDWSLLDRMSTAVMAVVFG